MRKPENRFQAFQGQPMAVELAYHARNSDVKQIKNKQDK